MVKGLWGPNPHGLVFDENDTLIDGGHRLNSVIEANVPVAMMVITMAPNRIKLVLDRSKSRTVEDIGKFNGMVLPPDFAKSVLAVGGILSGGVIKKAESLLHVEPIVSALSEELVPYLSEAKKMCAEGSVKYRADYGALYYLCAKKYGAFVARGVFMSVFSGSNLAEGNSPVRDAHKLFLNVRVQGHPYHKNGPEIRTIMETVIPLFMSEGRKPRNWFDREVSGFRSKMSDEVNSLFNDLYANRRDSRKLASSYKASTKPPRARKTRTKEVAL